MNNMNKALYVSVMALGLSSAMKAMDHVRESDVSQEQAAQDAIAATVQRCPNEAEIAHLKAAAAEADRYICSIGIANLSENQAIELLAQYSKIMSQLNAVEQKDTGLEMIIRLLKRHIAGPLVQFSDMILSHENE